MRCVGFDAWDAMCWMRYKMSSKCSRSSESAFKLLSELSKCYQSFQNAFKVLSELSKCSPSALRIRRSALKVLSDLSKYSQSSQNAFKVFSELSKCSPSALEWPPKHCFDRESLHNGLPGTVLPENQYITASEALL